MRVRDPIHGTIDVSEPEREVIDSRFFQRLRHVRQLGFGELAFPGATHTRHAHSLGAMHVAGRLFDAISASTTLGAGVKERLRACVRAAVLCHDLGHMPFSHASEQLAPKLAALRLPSWLDEPGRAQATHEDFTAKVLCDSALTPTLNEVYRPLGLSAEAIASLVVGKRSSDARVFVEGGVDYWPLLRSLVSGELDADRMDYLLRDSFFTGVNYGRYDFEWLVQNLRAAVRNGRAELALANSAAFAFEDFLLSRYHMFLSVYFHHTSVAFDAMLYRFCAEAPSEFSIPTTMDAFVECDDIALWSALKASKNRWAKRIVERDGFKLVAQFTDRDIGYDLKSLEAALTQAGIEHFSVESGARFSKYQEGEGPSLFILDTPTGRLTEVAKYTPLYRQSTGAVRLQRVYVEPSQADQARARVAELTGVARP